MVCYKTRYEKILLCNVSIFHLDPEINKITFQPTISKPGFL